MTMAHVVTLSAAAIARRKACARGTVRTHGDGAPTPRVTTAVASTEYSISSAPAAEAEIVVVGVCEAEPDWEWVRAWLGVDESDSVMLPVCVMLGDDDNEGVALWDGVCDLLAVCDPVLLSDWLGLCDVVWDREGVCERVALVEFVELWLLVTLGV
jgi:hypothetical protein